MPTALLVLKKWEKITTHFYNYVLQCYIYFCFYSWHCGKLQPFTVISIMVHFNDYLGVKSFFHGGHGYFLVFPILACLPMFCFFGFWLVCIILLNFHQLIVLAVLSPEGTQWAYFDVFHWDSLSKTTVWLYSFRTGIANRDVNLRGKKKCGCDRCDWKVV